MAEEQWPLLPSDRQHQREPTEVSSYVTDARHQTKRYLTSKIGHYSVLVLVSLDISAIFGDLIMQLFTCEGRIPRDEGSKAQEGLGIVSLVFSCLFMVSRSRLTTVSVS